MNVEGKKVLVVGTGKSGIAAAALLAKEKAAPVLFDENKDTDAEEVKKKLPDAEIEVITGTLPEGILDELELAVLSPGVPVDTPFVEKFREEIPRYMVKHQVRPGLTGWAQVNGYRGNTSIRKRIDYDLYYIENWSVGLDVKIILLTFFKGFINKNAY